MKKLLIYFIALHSIAVYSQDPYFANSNGDMVDGTFELCDLPECDILNPTGDNVNCAQWDYSTAAGFSAPLVYNTSCSLVDSSQSLLIEDHVCSLQYISGVSNQSIEATIHDLIPNSSYKITYYYFNEGQVVSGSAGPNPDARLRATCGDNSQDTGDISSSNTVTGPNGDFKGYTRVDFIFTASEEIMPFSLTPILPTNNTLVNTILLVDRISIILLEGGEELDSEIIEISQPCKECTSFELSFEEKYIISGWVRLVMENELIDLQVPTYSQVGIAINFDGSEVAHFFSPSGNIINGWQKIVGTFEVPSNASEIRISLQNDGNDNDAYFDDIRIHPYNGNLKSFVYDQETQKLMAELDENNYATFYEYDKEGGLVRVKKETEQGVKTIQETRSSNVKR